MRGHVPLWTVVFIFAGLLGPAGAHEADEGAAFFETRIRPQLIQHCYGCHSAEAKNVKGGLYLDTRAGVLAGGESGAAVVPGRADESLLLSAIRYEEYEMPPQGKLPDSVIDDFADWIEMGAPDPRTDRPVTRRAIDVGQGRSFWAFQAVRAPSVPAVQDDWPQTDVDRFVWAAFTTHGLRPVRDADSATWLRRVTFDLTGLPPSDEMVRSFLRHDDEAARMHVVDQLLGAPQFGERWAQHWLDVARFAESSGKTRNFPFPYAWRYRDYVIRAFTKDKPFDEFVVEQIAGDLLPAEDEVRRHELLTATGFLAVGSPDLNERDEEVAKMDTVADQIDTIGRSLLGLTVGCARCHDHKFDPIPTTDYYALAGIFTSTERLNGYAARRGGGNSLRTDLLIPLSDSPLSSSQLSADEQLVSGLPENAARRLLKAKDEVDKAQAKVTELRAAMRNSDPQQRRQLVAARALNKQQQLLNQLKNKLHRGRTVTIDIPMCMGVREGTQIANCRVRIRGEAGKLGDEVPRGFLQVLTTERKDLPAHQSGRLELAHWIVREENPLTARVIVNRVWHHLFGQGLVSTVDNFGATGARPTHPELLDYLAHDFMTHGWSVKRLIRTLVLSRTYGLDVVYDAHNASIDADNAWLWRMNSRRLDYEAMRDALLMASGELVTTPPSGSVVEPLAIQELSRQAIDPGRFMDGYRSVYLPVLRNLAPPEATAFDQPDASETRGAHDVTTVPTQSLYLMNSDFVTQRARHAANVLLEGRDHSQAAIAEAAYLRLFSRYPTEDEVERLCRYVTERMARSGQLGSSREQAWTEAIHAMFASAAFRYR